jgi:uncharacterized damage-inducible protein DinB
MQPSPSMEQLRDALLFEFDVADKQLRGLVETIPAEQFNWRPNESTRSVSEVFVHVAAGNFFLLGLMGHEPSSDLYGTIPHEGEQRMWAIVRRNDELEKTISSKDEVTALLIRSLDAVRQVVLQINESKLADELTRRAYFRVIAHSHEHMGQLIAYTRVMGLRVPWSDWRPDRR